MKIAILTFIWTSDNYGQLLQAYALQRYLKNLGHNVFFIRYQMGRISFREQLRFFRYDPIKRIKHFSSLLSIKRKHQESQFKKNNPRFFDEFRNRFFEFSPQQYTTIKQLRKNPPEADVYICGSDQIWNMSVFENARAYFLDFGSTSVRRIAYAASFGKKDIQKPFSKFIKPMLSRFNAISVRESSGKDICSKAGYTTSTKVVDPTFLLRVEDYKVLLNSQLEWKAKKKCLCYFLNFKKPSDVYWNDIKEMAILRDIDMRLVVSSGAKDAFDILDSEYYAPSPYDFITSIKLSDFVITNSYHGTIFAILMEKQFIVIPLASSHSGMNERIFSLLNELNLSNRLYNPNKKDLHEILTKKIDWCGVRQKINGHSQYSMNWLNDNLKK